MGFGICSWNLGSANKKVRCFKYKLQSPVEKLKHEKERMAAIIPEVLRISVLIRDALCDLTAQTNWRHIDMKPCSTNPAEQPLHKSGYQ